MLLAVKPFIEFIECILVIEKKIMARCFEIVFITVVPETTCEERYIYLGCAIV